MAEAVKALIKKLIEFRVREINELKSFLETLEVTPEPVLETLEAEFLSRGNQVYARVFRENNEISIFPIESYAIKAEDRAIKWLKKRFREAKEKHPDFEFAFVVGKDGKLEKISVKGNLEEYEKLQNAVIWALEKAGNR